MDVHKLLDAIRRDLDEIERELTPYRESQWMTPRDESQYSYLLGKRMALNTVFYHHILENVEER